MKANYIPEDINQYRVFVTADHKFGIMTWDKKHVFPPKCLTAPNVEELEDFGYTFVRLQSGYNLIDERGQLLLNEEVAEIAWVIRSKIVAFKREDETENLFFIEKNHYVYNLTDLNFEKQNLIRIFREKLVGLVAKSGVEIFSPEYFAVAAFASNIYIAYGCDGKMFLNAEGWESKTNAVSDVKAMNSGILAKYVSGEYAWINPSTGKDMAEDELTIIQRNILIIAKKRGRI